MSNHKNRLQQLEKKHAPQDRQIIVVIYDHDGRAMKCESNPEVIGMTRDEITARLDNENTTLLNVVYASDANKNGAVFIPDNEREKSN